MRLYDLLAVAAGLFLAADALPQTDAGGKTDPLQGEWKLLSTQDEKHTDPGCDKSGMIVQADGGVVFKLAGLTLNHGTLTFGTAGKLKSLDLKLADGKTLLGVYEQRGDDLTICFEEAGKERPAGTAPKGTQWAEKWKRAKR
ncbi:MAG TPA: hypothetical protein VKA46_37885 [Gemmataceae bacterium]|nr:hypothetical protein [Gemmataceae bacterium]